MTYLLFVAIAVVSAIVIGIIGARKGVVKIGNFALYKPCEEDIVPFQGKSLILTTLICLASSVAVQISLYNNTSIINFVKLYGLFVIVFAAGLIDVKRRIIPNLLILIGLVFRAGIYVYEIFTAENLKSILINDLIGFGIGFLFLAVVSFLTKGALGFGDVKLFGVIGLTAGSFCTYSTLLLGLVLSAVISLVCIAMKKMNRKDSFPFGPCITAGYILAILLVSY